MNAKRIEKEILTLYSSKNIKQLKPKSILKKISSKPDKDTFYKALNNLLRKGKLTKNKDGLFSQQQSKKKSTSRKPMETISGYVDVTRSGSAFIIADTSTNDIFVSARNLNGALNGDRVELELFSRRGKRREGRVRKVLERLSTEVIAFIHNVGHSVLAHPVIEGAIGDIAIDPIDMNGAHEGDLVLIEITQWPKDARKPLKGRVTNLLTGKESHEVDDLNILIKYGFNPGFPAVVERYTQNIRAKGLQWKAEDRIDFRKKTTFTIDPEDAKDFDDAISIEVLEGGNIEIGIHIADVTHYLRHQTPLDREAHKRSTSVYLVGRVCPMLPEILSNDLCSLVEGEDRLTFSVIVTLSPNFKIIDSKIAKTVIHSDKRFSYEQAQEIIEGKNHRLSDEIHLLNKISKTLRNKRNRKGAINFDSTEVRFLLDEKKYPTDIYVKERKDAHLLVEDFMLLANKIVAEFMGKKLKGRIPFVYRIHDQPDMSKLGDLSKMAGMLGLKFDINNISSIRKSFDKLHKAAQKNEAFKILETMGIRSMAKAVYSPTNIGHFGLSFDYYTHFTSPIRRYADVLVHRIIFAFLENKKPVYSMDILTGLCKTISRKERLAMDAEWESIRAKQAVYYAQFIGDEFDGKITGIRDRGFFVSLETSGASGMISFGDFDEYFELHPTGFSAVGQKTGRIFALGDRLRVRIADVDMEQKLIDLELVD